MRHRFQSIRRSQRLRRWLRRRILQKGRDMRRKDDKSSQSEGAYLTTQRGPQPLRHHPTDFSVMDISSTVRGRVQSKSKVRDISPNLCRVSTTSTKRREEAMTRLRADQNCAV